MVLGLNQALSNVGGNRFWHDRPGGHANRGNGLLCCQPSPAEPMGLWGVDKPEQKRQQGSGGIGWLRSPDGDKVVRIEGAG